MDLTDPLWLLALLLIPIAVGVQALLARRRRRYAVRFPALGTLAAVAPSSGGWRRWVPLGLLLAALAGMVVAMTRPERTVAVPIDRASVMLIQDTSNSMLADDVSPSRHVAAQQAARQFVETIPDGLQVGAVAYSTGPYDVVAPTEDKDEVLDLIDSISPDGATATGEAIAAALDALRDVRGEDGRPAPAAIVLLSDGQTTAGRNPIEVAREAKRVRVPIYTVSLGTPSGTIPGPGGSVVSVPPDPESLRRISRITGGQSFEIDDAAALEAVYQRLGSRIGSKKETRELTAGFAAIGAALLAAAMAASVRWGARFP
ncbi:MAG TPA: VWA domain-containing protein [Capillimicrobium sp.]|nr:VWA domain-containing protein [Capillimicrobium sp.]